VSRAGIVGGDHGLVFDRARARDECHAQHHELFHHFQASLGGSSPLDGPNGLYLFPVPCVRYTDPPSQGEEPDMKLFDLSGRVAVVTGGNGGIGLGMALGMAQAGATSVVAGRDVAKNAAAVKEIQGAGAKASAIPVDVLKEESCRALIADTMKAHGRLDILVNNAGMSIRKQPEQYTLAEWHTVMDSNLTSAFLCSHAAYPEMKKGAAGKIITTGSMMSICGAPFATAYAASKGGMVQMTKSMATAWAKDNIQVNAILPGWIDTALTRRAREQADGLHDSVLKRTPAGRWGLPDDFAGVAVFLAAPASDFVTGATLAV